ncbi:MAG: hypothetical protein Kilf2KO_04820 [Rhodospirillales bacterium]
MPTTGRLYRFNRAAAMLAGLGLFMMMAIGAVDAFSTKVLSAPLPGVYELTETLMVMSAFLALALAQANDGHIRVTIFVGLLSPRWRALLDLFGALLTALLFIAIAWFGWASAIHSFAVGEFSPGSLPIPIWPARLALALGASLMVVQSAVDLARNAALLGKLPSRRA